MTRSLPFNCGIGNKLRGQCGTRSDYYLDPLLLGYSFSAVCLHVCLLISMAASRHRVHFFSTRLFIVLYVENIFVGHIMRQYIELDTDAI